MLARFAAMLDYQALPSPTRVPDMSKPISADAARPEVVRKQRAGRITCN